MSIPGEICLRASKLHVSFLVGLVPLPFKPSQRAAGLLQAQPEDAAAEIGGEIMHVDTGLLYPAEQDPFPCGAGADLLLYQRSGIVRRDLFAKVQLDDELKLNVPGMVNRFLQPPVELGLAGGRQPAELTYRPRTRTARVDFERNHPGSGQFLQILIDRLLAHMEDVRKWIRRGKVPGEVIPISCIARKFEKTKDCMLGGSIVHVALILPCHRLLRSHSAS